VLEQVVRDAATAAGRHPASEASAPFGARRYKTA
jgi:hypothetical protein